MDITVSARHMEVSPALRTAAEEKIGRLGRFGDGIRRAEVHFSEEQNRRIAAKETCEVTLTGDGSSIHCKVAAGDPFTAVDLAIAKLEPQLHKAKVKQLLRTHKGQRRAAAPGAELPEAMAAEA